MADSDEKLGRLVSVCRYLNVFRMCVRLNDDLFQKVDCFKSLGSQVVQDGECERDVVHRMNEGSKPWGVLKSVPNNR